MATAFQEKVYALCSMVPKGRVTTYAAIAEALGTKAYRAVGSALNHNQHPIMIPCHRVVNSDGRIGGYSGGIDKKISLLAQEGVHMEDGRIAGFTRRLYVF